MSNFTIRASVYLRAGAFASLLLIAPSVVAETTMCRLISDDLLMPETVMWNSKTDEATVSTDRGEKYEGRVTLIRPHADEGPKVNIVYKDWLQAKNGLGRESEMIIFPIPDQKHRAIAVAMVMKDGTRHFDYAVGEAEADCSSL